jgi:hypothetical protein
MDAVARGDRQAWVENFTDDAIIEDPVGKSMIDPAGKGHRGKAAIETFWDQNIANVRPMFCLQSSICCGNECANIGTLTIQFENGMITQLYGMFKYTVDDGGRVTALRTFWETDDMVVYPPFAQRGD